MEDDNALDIIKWLFKEGTKVDFSGTLIREDNGTSSHWEAKLRGNLLAMKPMEIAAVPQLFVCEKIQLRKDDGNPATFHLKYSEDELRLSAESEEEAEKWLIKLATCSHQMVQAELDQTMQKHYAETTQPSPTESKSFEGGALPSYFLTASFKKEHSFYIYQSVGVPNRMVVCRELMCESKLSLVIPLDMLKLSIGWASQLRDDLLGNLWTVRNGAILEALHNAVRHLNSNIEVYTQATEFLDGYMGPSFRPSIERYRMAFAAVPTNLHVQYFQVNGQPSAHFITCGATIAAPLRFANGGLYRIRNKFVAGLEPSTLDFTNEYRFYARRKALTNVKRQLGELTRRIEVDWHVTKFGMVDKVGVEIFSQVKQLHETVCDIVQSFPNISNLVDGLCANGYIQLEPPNTLPDTLANQLDCLDASMISLNSKMAVIDIINDDLKGRESFEESAKAALNFTLDALLHVVESVLLAQLLSLTIAFRRTTDCQTFFSIQLRHDLLLSQALTVVTTALLTSLQESSSTNPQYTRREKSNGNVDVVSPLISYFSFLSCYGDERGMMEDMFEMWTNFGNYVQFRYIPANSAVSQTCVPQIEGYRTDLQVSIPLCPSLYEKLPQSFVSASSNGASEWFRVETVLWNIGVNHEATLACSLGDISLEENVNRSALSRLQNYISKNFPMASPPISPEKHSEQSSMNVISKDVEKADDCDVGDDVKNAVSTASEKMNNKSVDSDNCVEEIKQNNKKNSSDNTAMIHVMLADLKKMVNACPSRKNLAIFSKVVALTNALGGFNAFSCKSGKDRTAMAVTLEEGRILKETCGISQQQMREVIDCLRRDGVRRENCRKNVGKALYSFSPFQMHFIPKEFRPPNGTYSQIVNT